MGSNPSAVADRPTTGPLTELTLRDGTPALIWPLLDTDRDLLQQGYAELSAASRRSRFLTELPELSEALLRSLVDDVDGSDHVAVVLTVLPPDGGARPIGVARLVRDPQEPAMADVAVTVLDAWQGQGVGAHLLADLSARAAEHSVTRLRADVLRANDRALRLLRRGGWRAVEAEGVMVTLERPLTASAPAGAARARSAGPAASRRPRTRPRGAAAARRSSGSGS
jgi:GNAT superfamily N-acetyltransferase